MAQNTVIATIDRSIKRRRLWLKVTAVLFCEQMKGNAVGWRNFTLPSWDDDHPCHKELWWTHFYSRVDAYGTNSFEIVEASGHPMPRHHLKERGDEGRLQSLQDSTGSKRWEGGFVVRQTSGILRLHTTSSQYAFNAETELYCTCS